MGDELEPEKAHLRHALADVIRAHQFLSSRAWPDGSDPVGPEWNPGCTCGASHYYFEHDLHVADALLASGAMPYPPGQST